MKEELGIELVFNRIKEQINNTLMRNDLILKLLLS